MSEIPEVSMAMLSDSKLLAMLNKYPDAIDSIHFSDQYSGPKVKKNCDNFSFIFKNFFKILRFLKFLDFQKIFDFQNSKNSSIFKNF